MGINIQSHLVLAAALMSTLRAADAPPPVLAIQPLGSVPAARVEVVRNGLAKVFGREVTILPEKPMPKAAWYAPRSRYRAEKLLDELASGTDTKPRLVLGLTAKDISTTKGEHEDWGIFGLGEVGGRVCVVSTYRLSARGADEKLLRERLVKVAIHEAGHVMGLEHCPNPGCVMRDAEASIATVDAESDGFCDSCKAVCTQWLSDHKP